jgi:hypothetical protein
MPSSRRRYFIADDTRVPPLVKRIGFISADSDTVKQERLFHPGRDFDRIVPVGAA